MKKSLFDPADRIEPNSLAKHVLQTAWVGPRNEMVKALDCGVQTPVALLRSRSEKYPWERYEASNPLRYGLNSTSTFLLAVRFGIK